MNKFLIPLLFVLLFAAQWSIPAHMIYEQEKVLTQGTPYKFKTRPIDPSDPLRGKYIVLNYDMNKVKALHAGIKDRNEFYLYIDTDSIGFAKAVAASTEKLSNNLDYVKVRANYSNDSTVYFQLPFKRFYMEESKAYEAEVYVRQATRDTVPLNCYGLVYIKDDKATLKDVIVDDMPIKDYVLQQRTQQKNAE